MNAQDTFFYAASAGIFVGVILFGYLVFELVNTLRHIRNIAQDVEDTTHDVALVKNGLKVGILSLLLNVLGGSRRGGDMYGRV